MTGSSRSGRLARATAGAIAGALLLAGCLTNDNGGAVGSGNGPATASLGSRVPAAVRQRGTLRVGVVPGRPPLATLPAGAPSPTGADVDLARQVASSLGLKLEVVAEADGAAAASDLSAGKLDAAMAGTVDVPSARTGVSFVDYLAGDQGGPLAIATPAAGPGPSVTRAMADALKAMVADQRYQAILDKWGVGGRALPAIGVDGVSA